LRDVLERAPQDGGRDDGVKRLRDGKRKGHGEEIAVAGARGQGESGRWLPEGAPGYAPCPRC
jgi:hypothetical protein